MAEILHENNKVWLDVDPYYPPKHKHPNTAFKATAIATQAMGEGLRYELLMGISGAAFRVQLHEEWCPSSPHPNCGFDCSAIAMAAIEFRTLPLFDCAADAARQPSTQDAIIASIDRGHPVLLCAKETGLVVGYLADGDERQLLIREPYSNRGDEPVPLEE
ncbi:MAG: hypothetical protein GY842_08890, partial [bacterium]|nr:hypothetical protein [bacterium]